eukprot:CAMPEP_0185746722 /NCGR_PEP_ID=MMETSP1174-20130828/5344_1 /TAXON_ID=35687 /ORGANISM="Dictyocha speculum, Strain CCMP1381" /LENGTH=186 /DNA_ID=CAMNT_0028421581 /DNA_START=44 /DNA_END=604 /DNA_ORIENTATION=+
MVRALPLLLASIALFVSASAEKDEVSISFENMGRSALGVLFVGNETQRRLINYEVASAEELSLRDFELLSDVLHRGEYSTHKTHFHHAFELRTADFQFRAKVVIYKNFHAEVGHLPYIIMFKNLMSESSGGTPAFIELRHSNTGYVWLHPEEEVAHASDAEHFYELRNVEHESIVLMRLIHGHPEL